MARHEWEIYRAMNILLVRYCHFVMFDFPLRSKLCCYGLLVRTRLFGLLAGYYTVSFFFAFVSLIWARDTEEEV